MKRREAIEAYVNAEIDKYKRGGDIIFEAEAIAKVAFYCAFLRAAHQDDEDGYLKCMATTSMVTSEILDHMPGNATVEPTEPS